MKADNLQSGEIRAYDGEMDVWRVPPWRIGREVRFRISSR